MKSIATSSSQAASVRRPIVRVSTDQELNVDDVLVVEEPLEIQLVQQPAKPGAERTLSITMRTPGHDDELAVGFLLGEGIIQSPSDVIGVRHCGPPSPDKGYQNVIQVELSQTCEFDETLFSRNFYTTSSCGVCGKTSIDAINLSFPLKSEHIFDIKHQAMTQLPQRLKQWQTEFNRTGGIHASATFDANGEIQRVREDVGRHNALDKLIGSYFFEDGSELHSLGLLLSGRASFELVQKAAMAQISLIAAIGSPSNLAVELAEERNITLIGFLRESGFNTYTSPQSGV